MRNKKDLLKLIELAQMDFTKKREGTLKKYKQKIIDLFATEPTLVDEAEDMTLERMQDHIKSIVQSLLDYVDNKNNNDMIQLDIPVTIFMEDNDIWVYRHWEDHLRNELVECLKIEDIKKDLHICPVCGRLFVQVGKREKLYCSNRCGVEANRGNK